MLEYNEQKLAAKREQTEDEVRKRGTDITEYLETLAKDIHSFYTVEAEVQSEIFANNQKLTTLRYDKLFFTGLKIFYLKKFAGQNKRANLQAE